MDELEIAWEFIRAQPYDRVNWQKVAWVALAVSALGLPFCFQFQWPPPSRPIPVLVEIGCCLAFGSACLAFRFRGKGRGLATVFPMIGSIACLAVAFGTDRQEYHYFPWAMVWLTVAYVLGGSWYARTFVVAVPMIIAFGVWLAIPRLAPRASFPVTEESDGLRLTVDGNPSQGEGRCRYALNFSASHPGDLESRFDLRDVYAEAWAGPLAPITCWWPLQFSGQPDAMLTHQYLTILQDGSNHSMDLLIHVPRYSAKPAGFCWVQVPKDSRYGVVDRSSAGRDLNVVVRGWFDSPGPFGSARVLKIGVDYPSESSGMVDHAIEPFRIEDDHGREVTYGRTGSSQSVGRCFDELQIDEVPIGARALQFFAYRRSEMLANVVTFRFQSVPGTR